MEEGLSTRTTECLELLTHAKCCSHESKQRRFAAGQQGKRDSRVGPTSGGLCQQKPLTSESRDCKVPQQRKLGCLQHEPGHLRPSGPLPGRLSVCTMNLAAAQKKKKTPAAAHTESADVDVLAVQLQGSLTLGNRFCPDPFL